MGNFHVNENVRHGQLLCQRGERAEACGCRARCRADSGACAGAGAKGQDAWVGRGALGTGAKRLGVRVPERGAGRRGVEAGGCRERSGFVHQKRDSAWMAHRGRGGSELQVRVPGGFVRQKRDSARICVGSEAAGNGKSVHYRRFSTCGGVSPALGRPSHPRAPPPPVHYRRFGTRGGVSPAPSGVMRPFRAVPPPRASSRCAHVTPPRRRRSHRRPRSRARGRRQVSGHTYTALPWCRPRARHSRRRRAAARRPRFSTRCSRP